MSGLFRSRGCAITLLFAIIFCAASSPGYSVLTHQELIDLAWNDSIRPMLLARFPGATEEQLRVAHAYAYGGASIQDMGYYPFGKQFFSDLTHYVRSGDFIAWLFRNSRTIDEYAFAIGALSHYMGDSIGHSEVINPATAVEFPKLGVSSGTLSLMTKALTVTFEPNLLLMLRNSEMGTLRRRPICLLSVSMSQESFLNRLLSILTDLIFMKCWAEPIQLCEAIARPYAALFPRLRKQKWCCIAISFRHIPTTKRTGSLPSVLLVQTMSGTGSTRGGDPVSRRICWRF